MTDPRSLPRTVKRHPVYESRTCHCGLDPQSMPSVFHARTAVSLSAWLYANMAFRQTMWACNPTTFTDPFTFVPLVVTQPYYIESAENQYCRVRRSLQNAGAKTSLDKAKQLWQDTCKLQSERTRVKVQNSNDLLETVVAEGAETLTSFLANLKVSKRLSFLPNQLCYFECSAAGVHGDPLGAHSGRWRCGG